ncbi:hypothetical protein Taro_052282 [Colocasia esculenta]|uniref:Uncharacterized protein n=1 Tax=Colocasia esculenta TaxID=4460 RepID=A0A843XJ98_COLES|nr:hypothetical protein [Colocasia esculenta]
MSAVNITNVTVLDNPAAFLKPFQFEISYECLTPLKDDGIWIEPAVVASAFKGAFTAPSATACV